MLRRALLLAALVPACSLGLGENLSGGPDDAADASTQTDGGGATTDGGGSTSDSSTGTDTGADALTPPDPDLVGWWKLDETSGTAASDSSSYGGNTGTIKGAVAWTPGKKNGAVVLGGSSWIEVASHPSMKVTTKLTVAFWVRVDTEVDDARVFQYSYGFNIKLNNAHPQLEMSAGYAVLTATVPVGSWHHVAFTFDAGTVKGYFDAFPVDFETNTLTPGATFTAETDEVRLGSTVEDTYVMNGALDDVRFYRRVLTAQEIGDIVK